MFIIFKEENNAYTPLEQVETEEELKRVIRENINEPLAFIDGAWGSYTVDIEIQRGING